MLAQTETAERIRELLTRNLQKVFGEGDDERRRAAIDALWAQDAVLYAPPGAIVGATDREVCGRPARDASGLRLTPHGEPQALHNAGRLAWGSGPPDGAPAYTGWDVIIVHEGKIAALYVFLDESSDEFRKSAAYTG